jgi:hypothetical protein
MGLAQLDDLQRLQSDGVDLSRLRNTYLSMSNSMSREGETADNLILNINLGIDRLVREQKKSEVSSPQRFSEIYYNPNLQPMSFDGFFEENPVVEVTRAMPTILDVWNNAVPNTGGRKMIRKAMEFYSREDIKSQVDPEDLAEIDKLLDKFDDEV